MPEVCKHCGVYLARPKSGKCRVCSVSPMTKKEIIEAREQAGLSGDSDGSSDESDGSGRRPKTKKKRYVSPVKDEHITAYFKIIAAEHGKRSWMKSRFHRNTARSKLESMLTRAAYDYELVPDDHEFGTSRATYVDGKRVEFVTLDELTVLMEERATLQSIGLL